MNLSNLNNEILVSENKHQYNHTYDINLSSFIEQYKINKQPNTCHLCCLFALKCFHQIPTLNYSINSNIQYRDEKNYNAILSSIDIWKDDINKNNSLKQNHSPLYDIPLCFHNNFSLNYKENSSRKNFENEKLLEPIKKILSSHRSYESLLRHLPSPPKTRFSRRSSNDSNIIEPITLIDDLQKILCYFNHIYLFSKLQNNDSFVPFSSSSSSSIDVNYSPSKKLKLMNEEMLIEKLSTPHHQSNEKSILIDNKLIKSKNEHHLSSQITINQLIKDINTNIETSIESTSKILVKSKTNPKSQSKYFSYENKLKKSHSITLHNKNHLKYSSFPTVPKCFNEYFQINFNSLLNKKLSKLSKKYFQLNIFDSNLFQWQIFNSNQYENYFCRKNSLLLFHNNNNKSSIEIFINSIQSQRQHVPSEYSSWNIFFPNYHPIKFSLKNSNSNENRNVKNPYGRTGLIGQSLLENFGPNRYIISLIITEKNHNKYILLNDAWIEVQIVLIKNSYQYFHKKTWFLIQYLHKLNNIEYFDFNLIQFYT
ncbi:unnamed protein product [Rotaria sp. Silwood2]|nr:unnamed protein product [Rotaria sp. Silwood2]